jgi:hypothetical protein
VNEISEPLVLKMLAIKESGPFLTCEESVAHGAPKGVAGPAQPTARIAEEIAMNALVRIDPITHPIHVARPGC